MFKLLENSVRLWSKLKWQCKLLKHNLHNRIKTIKEEEAIVGLRKLKNAKVRSQIYRDVFKDNGEYVLEDIMSYSRERSSFGSQIHPEYWNARIEGRRDVVAFILSNMRVNKDKTIVRNINKEID